MKTSTKNKSIEWNVFLEAMNNLLIQNEIKKKVITKEKNNNIKLCMNTPWWQNKALTELVFFFLQAVTQDTGQVAGSSDNNDKKPTEKHFRL